MANPVTSIPVKRDFAPNARSPMKQVIDALNNLQRLTATIDFASIAATSTLTQALAVPAAVGVALNDVFLAIPPANWPTGVIAELAYGSAANQITLRVRNLTGGAIDPPSGVWTFMLVKHSPLSTL